MLFTRCDKCNTEVDASTLTEREHFCEGARTVFKLCEKCLRLPIPAGSMLLNEGRR